MLRVSQSLNVRHALALGLAQGPTELLPVSSSAHTTLIPYLLRWPYAELDDELRKSFEVALHAGTGVALALDMRGELLREAPQLNARRVTVIALSLAPPVLAGLSLRSPIERHLGGPRSIAACLAAGALAMALADARAGPGGRLHRDACPRDALALGLAQAIALVPGVSRYGATLTAARARGFARGEARTLSWHAALPVILGAGALEGARLARRGAPASALAPLGAGALGAFVSTLASARLWRRPARAEDSLAPYALYRCLLAALVVARRATEHRLDHGTAHADPIQ